MKLVSIVIILISSIVLSSCSDDTNKEVYLPSSKEMEIKTYKFGIHPYMNSKKMFIFYRPILDFIEDNMGNIEIILETSSSYSDYNKKLYNGDFDFSLPNPFQTYNSLKKGYKVFARMKPDTVFRGIFLARKDSNIKTVNQLKGEYISFPAPTALAATMMPLLYLHEHGLNVNKDIEKKYVGSQYSSILNVYSSDTIVGATWPPPWETFKRENPEKAKQMEIVWETKSLINNGIVVKDGTDKRIVKELVDILINLDKTKKGQKLLFDAGFEGFVKSNDDDYSVVADFLKKYDQAIGIPK